MKKVLIIGVSFLLPLVASAQLTQIQGNIITPIGRIISMLIPIVFALALLYFFWGLAQYILSSGEEASQAEGRRKMIWGVVALFVMSAVWGLVRFLGTNLGITDNSNVPIPTVPGGQTSLP